MQLSFGGTLHALALPFAKLAFWRKPAADGSADAAPPEAAPEAAPAAETDDTASDAPAPKPGLWQRVTALFRRKREAAPETATEDTPEAVPTATDDEASEAPTPRPGLLARFKGLFRRKAAPLEGEEESTEAEAPDTVAEGEEGEPAPRGLLHKLRSKWVWIPALVILLLALIGGVAALFIRSAHETQRLQQELQAAKRKLEQQAKAPAPAPVVVAAPVAKPPEAPVKKPDPAFDIIGAKPAPEAESGLNAGDCVVSDREQVAANLKRCIEAFNATASTSGKKPK